MKTQKIINLLNNSSNEESKFATKSSLCDYSDAFILVTGNITVAADNNTDVTFKNLHHFLHV